MLPHGLDSSCACDILHTVAGGGSFEVEFTGNHLEERLLDQAQVRDLLSGRPTGRGGGGWKFWVGGCPNTPPPSPRGGTILGPWVL